MPSSLFGIPVEHWLLIIGGAFVAQQCFQLFKAMQAHDLVFTDLVTSNVDEPNEVQDDSESGLDGISDEISDSNSAARGDNLLPLAIALRVLLLVVLLSGAFCMLTLRRAWRKKNKAENGKVCRIQLLHWSLSQCHCRSVDAWVVVILS